MKLEASEVGRGTRVARQFVRRQIGIDEHSFTLRAEGRRDSGPQGVLSNTGQHETTAPFRHYCALLPQHALVDLVVLPHEVAPRLSHELRSRTVRVAHVAQLQFGSVAAAPQSG
jgi:hypothetical protein